MVPWFYLCNFHPVQYKQGRVGLIKRSGGGKQLGRDIFFNYYANKKKCGKICFGFPGTGRFAGHIPE